METLKDYQNNIKEAVTFFHSISDKKDELITICLENHLKAQIKSFQKQEEIIHKNLTTINAKPLDINTFLKDKTIDFANELKKKQESYNQKRSLHNTYYPLYNNNLSIIDIFSQNYKEGEKENNNYGEFLEEKKISLLLNKNEMKGLGFLNFENFPIPNIFCHSSIFFNHSKKYGRPQHINKNLSHKNSNFNVYQKNGVGLTFSDDFCKFFAAFVYYIKQTNYNLGTKEILKIDEILKIQNLKYKGENPENLYKTLEIIFNNTYLIEIYGKKRKEKQLIIGHKKPFRFIKHLKKIDRNTIEIAFDPRIALLFNSAINDNNGNIIYKNKKNKETQKIEPATKLQTTYSVFSTYYLKHKKIKKFLMAIYLQLISTNNYVVNFDITKLKTNYFINSNTYKIKHYIFKYIQDLKSFFKINEKNQIIFLEDENNKNIIKFYRTKYIKEKFIETKLIEFNRIMASYEKILETIKRLAPEKTAKLIKLLETYQKQIIYIAGQLKRNKINIAEMGGEFFHIYQQIKKDKKEKKSSLSSIAKIKEAITQTFKEMLPMFNYNLKLNSNSMSLANMQGYT